MVRFLYLAALSFFLLEPALASSFRVDCFKDKRIENVSRDTSISLCSHVNSMSDIEAVITCYYDKRLEKVFSSNAALLCSQVKSSDDIDRVIECYRDERISNLNSNYSTLLCL